MDIVINYWAVLVSGVVSMVIGSIWYGPLFGKKFIKESGMESWSAEKREAMKKSMYMTYLWQFIASLVMFYVLAHMMALSQYFYNYSGIKTGLTTALCVWIGFVVPIQLGEALWGGKMSLFWLGMGNMLVTLLVAGAIIGAW